MTGCKFLTGTVQLPGCICLTHYLCRVQDRCVEESGCILLCAVPTTSATVPACGLTAALPLEGTTGK